jgi:hypothetical protein
MICSTFTPLSFALFMVVIGCEAVLFKRRIAATQTNRSNDRYIVVNLLTPLRYKKRMTRIDFLVPIDDVDISSLVEHSATFRNVALRTGVSWFLLASVFEVSVCR